MDTNKTILFNSEQKKINLIYHTKVSKAHLATVILFIKDFYGKGAELKQKGKIVKLEDILTNLEQDIEVEHDSDPIGI